MAKVLIAAQSKPEFTLGDLARYDGLFLGLLDEHERDGFDNAVEVGWAERSYEGGGGFLGLPKVRITAEGRQALEADE